MKPFFTEHIIKNFCEDTEVWTYKKKAEYLNRVLEERCVRVSGRRFFDGVWEIEEMVCGKSNPNDTHTALMLPPEPIEQSKVQLTPEAIKAWKVVNEFFRRINHGDSLDEALSKPFEEI